MQQSGGSLARILIAWELGANLGHLLRQLMIARELRRRDHQVLFACRDLQAAAAIAGGEGFACVQAPSVRAGPRPAPKPQCYADMLATCGFGEAASLEAAVCGWFGLMDLYRPDALLCDHAPLAQFAARLRGLPVMQVGTGFELPPATHPLPLLQARPALAEGDVLAREARLLTHMNKLCERHGSAALEQLSDLYQTQAPVLATFAELDHFARAPDAVYAGPLFSLSDGPEVAWQSLESAESRPRRVFAYLRADPSLPAVLQALQRSNAEVIAALPDCPAELIQRFRSERMRIFPHMVRAAVIDSADVVVNHGGHGLSAAALLAGATLCLLPRNLEQWLLARRVVQMGAGVSLDPDRVEGGVEQVITDLVLGGACRESALRFAEKYGEFEQVAAVRRIVAALECLSKGGSLARINESLLGWNSEHMGGDMTANTKRCNCLGTDAVHREPAMTTPHAGTVEASGQSETQHD